MSAALDQLPVINWADYRARKYEARPRVHPREQARMKRAETRRQRRANARLGNSANKVSEQGSETDQGPSESWFAERDEIVRDRTVNYRLFGEFDEHGKRERVANCGRVPVGKTGNVVAKRSGETGVAHFSGYQSCGSIWGCPVCAAKIRQFRAEEISAGLRKWMADGHFAFAVTLTMPHTFGMELDPLLDCIMKSWKDVLAGRARKEFWETEGVRGTIRAFDLTHGRNGWHPHLHNVILIENTGQSQLLLEERVREYFETRWSRSIERRGFGKVNLAKGVDVRQIKDASGVGTYVSKISYDLTRSDKKKAALGGKNQWELLRYGRTTGDAQAIALWKEYVQVTKGRRCIEWSRGLKKELLGIDETEELSDDEIAAQSTVDPPLAELDHKLAGYLGNNADAKVAALRGIEHNGADGLRFVLQYELGLPIRVEWVTHSRGDPDEVRIPKLTLAAR